MKLFISYAQSDLPRVQELAQLLNEAGHEAWFEREALPAQRWERPLRDQVEGSDAFISVVSKESLKNEWSKREFRIAKKARMPIFAVLVNANAQHDIASSDVKGYPLTVASEGVNAASIEGLVKQLTEVAGKITSKPQPVPTGVESEEDDHGEKTGPQLVEPQADMPEAVKGLLTQANTFLTNGQWDKAINKLNEIVTLLPENPLVYAARGDAYLGLEKYDKSLEDYDQVIRLAPDNGKAYDTRANLHRDLEHIDEAISDFTKSIELDPEHAFPHISRGMLYYQKTQIDDALKDFETYAEKEPEDYLGYNNAAFVLFQQGKYEEAEAAWAKATSLEDPDDYVFAGHAISLEQLNRPAEAVDMYKKAVLLNRRWKNKLDTVGAAYSWTEPMLQLATQIIGRLRASR
ncbi:MAG: tetratricopeptide repeat protein [Chloroflexi bacterium]|nr:tetratricopeptide repeat protein [Chloroflexota bacterium]MCC6893101.1 tetratricopeptide repeat protein [Anaerolineae bacterium]